jgi:hypothetical protein
MTLAEILANPLPAYEDLRKLWIVIDQEMYDLLMQLQPKYLHQVSPVRLTNGDYACCADLLGEKDGAYKPTFDILDQSFFPEIPVMEFPAIQLLLPVSAEEP